LTFRISILIKLTLGLLLIALTLPLPFLAVYTHDDLQLGLTLVGMVGGMVLLYLSLDDRVIVDEQGIKLVSSLPLKRGWYLRWDEISALKPKTTGQGGLVYYFLTKSGSAYLLPMRVAGFIAILPMPKGRGFLLLVLFQKNQRQHLPFQVSHP
jgi:hypothetical protein